MEKSRTHRIVQSGFRLMLATAATAASMGCAVAAKPEPAGFSGEWGVEWCDRANPGGDCGGFHVRLVQQGDRICGSYSGALVGLRQIDEGGARAILGGSVGDTAIVTVRSGRSGGLYLARVQLSGSSLHWHEFETIEPGGSDISVTGGTTVLVRQPGPLSAAYADTVEACRASDDAK